MTPETIEPTPASLLGTISTLQRLLHGRATIVTNTCATRATKDA